MSTFEIFDKPPKENLSGTEGVLLQNGSKASPGPYVHAASGDLLKRYHAAIYVFEGVASQTLVTPGTWYQLTQFTTDGLQNNAVADAANDKIELTNKGRYVVPWNCSFDGDHGVQYALGLYWNGTLQGSGKDLVKCVAGNFVKAGSTGIIAATTAGLDLELWARADTANASIAVKAAELAAYQMFFIA